MVGSRSVKISRIQKGAKQGIEDYVIIEQALEVRIRYRDQLRQVAITMRTPGDDIALASGFLFTEGIITDIADIIDTKIIEDNIIEFTISGSVLLPDGLFQRNTFMSSSCGICGKASLDMIRTHTQYLPWAAKFVIEQQTLSSLIDKLDEKQNLFSLTGGNHAVALFDLEANLLHIAEDVGRHNAMDKLIGYGLINDHLPLSTNICLLSGRASFELIQKAMMAGIGCVAAIGAPSSLAIELAEECGMTLLGFLKNNGANIYCGESRISF